MLPCTAETRVPRYLSQGSRQHALCPKAHRAESECVLQLSLVPSLNPSLLQQRPRMLPGASMAPHFGLLGLRMEQGFPSGDLGDLVPVGLTPFGRNQSLWPVLHQMMTLLPDGIPSPPHAQRRQPPVVDRLQSSQLPVQPAEAPGQLTGVERGHLSSLPTPRGPLRLFLSLSQCPSHLFCLWSSSI